MSLEAAVCCKSPHEEIVEATAAGKNVGREGRERVYKILDRISHAKPQVDVQRAVYFTRSMKETEGELLALRWAKAEKCIAENIEITIEDDQLIVGSGGVGDRYGIVYPELDANIFAESLKHFDPNSEKNPFNLKQSDVEALMDEVVPYWASKSFQEDLIKHTPKETLRVLYNPDDLLESRFIVDETQSYRSTNNWCPDYKKIIDRGLKVMKEEFQARLDSLDMTNMIDLMEKKPFLEAMIIVCDAMTIWAKRHAVKAREMAAVEKDSKRKQELLDIAERCDWVPENPARSFPEAVQSQWFVQMFTRLEQYTGSVISNGRMDQYFYPYFKADKEAGRLTDEQAMEYLECMWLQMSRTRCFMLSSKGNTFQDGYAHWEAVTIGGQDQDGRDATNELTYLFLRSKREFTLNFPDLSARIHANSPERYLREVALTIKEGSGYPKLFNDEEIIPTYYLSHGVPIKKAYEYCGSGCAEARLPNVETYSCCQMHINLVAPLEMALYNGKTYHNGDEVLGVLTGDPCYFKTFDDFWNAYVKQFDQIMHHAYVTQYNIIKLHPQHFAAPTISLMHDLCVASCKDLHSEKIPGGLDNGYLAMIGFATAADSIAAIKKLVYDDKVLTMKEVIDALKCNFEGKEVIRQMMVNAPKYGNNDLYVDNIAKDIERLYLLYAQKMGDAMDMIVNPTVVPVTAHVGYGSKTGATPNGRVAKFPLSDGTSASHGSDVNGPTAVLLSNYNAKNNDLTNRAARLLNIKFTPSAVAGEEGTDKLVSFIRTWCALKLWFVQFNVVNKETLIKAQKEPEKYKGLIVRVAGYSAYFTDLSKGVQDDVIGRTGHEAV